MKLKLPKKNGGEETAATAGQREKKPMSDTAKRVITTVVTLAVCAVICVVTNVLSGSFEEQAQASYNAAAKVESDIHNLQASDRYFTQDAERVDYREQQIKWVTPGTHEDLTSIDTGRWMADENIFWDFISPAFNFNSATEYNQMRESYIEKLGNCLFTVQFLGYYDIESRCRLNENGTVNQVDFERVNNAYTCTSDKKSYYTYPVAKDSDGNYSYVAMVPMKSVYVMFTYRIIHAPGQGGNERITLADFDCWPPDSNAKMGTTN